jgi:hypothetical protein
MTCHSSHTPRHFLILHDFFTRCLNLTFSIREARCWMLLSCDGVKSVCPKKGLCLCLRKVCRRSQRWIDRVVLRVVVVITLQEALHLWSCYVYGAGINSKACSETGGKLVRNEWRFAKKKIQNETHHCYDVSVHTHTIVFFTSWTHVVRLWETQPCETRRQGLPCWWFQNFYCSACVICIPQILWTK